MGVAPLEANSRPLGDFTSTPMWAVTAWRLGHESVTVKRDGWGDRIGREQAEVCEGSHTSCIEDKMLRNRDFKVKEITFQCKLLQIISSQQIYPIHFYYCSICSDTHLEVSDLNAQRIVRNIPFHFSILPDAQSLGRVGSSDEFPVLSLVLVAVWPRDNPSLALS